MWRSPLPNSNQPSSMRWRVGRSPTCRSIALTSCQGQPVSAARRACIGACSGAVAAAVKTMARDGVVGNVMGAQYPIVTGFWQDRYVCNISRRKRKVRPGSGPAPAAATYGCAQSERMSGFAPPPPPILDQRKISAVDRPHRRHRMLMTRRSSYDYDELLACGRGELFGAGNAQLPLPPMLMFDRISEVSETGGEHGKGMVRAVLDVKPDLWYFPCHFKGDPVMPGCLGLDALWQLLGFFLGWLGSSGKGRALGLGEVKFSGQVLPSMKQVIYGVDIKRVMRSKLVLGVADGWLKVDGAIIYRAMDIKVGLFRDVVLQPAT